MACLRPMLAYLDSRTNPRKVVFRPPDAWSVFGAPEGVRAIQIPCGKCVLCRQARAFEITLRAVAESRCYDFSSFITLTVDDEHLHSVFPFNKLTRRPYQLFLKRLRKKIGKFRYILCGEYGSRTGRAHYHLIVFGHRFVDGYVDRAGCWCPSRVISECWPFGLFAVDDVNSERIAYVAGYQLKNDPIADDQDFPQFVVWSRRPGLGFEWFSRYWSDMVRNGFTFSLDGKNVHLNGRYFLSKLQLISSRDYDTIMASRIPQQVDDTHIMRHEKNLRHAACINHRRTQRKVQSKL